MPYVPGMVQGVRDTNVPLCRTKNIHPQAILLTPASFLSPFPSHSKRRELSRGFLNVKLGCGGQICQAAWATCREGAEKPPRSDPPGQVSPAPSQTATNTIFT